MAGGAALINAVKPAQPGDSAPPPTQQQPPEQD